MKHLETVIIGAGLSGIGLACHLKQKCKEQEFAIIESRDRIGGTWDLFKYPGIRSDSDMSTMSYEFKPWPSTELIARGGDIRNYIEETAQEFDVAKNILFQHRLKSARWNSQEQRWILKLLKPSGESVDLSCNFLSLCNGYYRYDQGHRPQFKNQENFKGIIVHPQHWPENLDYNNKNVVVIGSGATAMTLVPNMASKTKHIYLLQRSPTYVVSMSNDDPIAKKLNHWFSKSLAQKLTWFKNVQLQRLIGGISKRWPGWMKNLLLKRTQKSLGPEYDVNTHFNPRYNPMEQRMCLIPDGDLFKVLREKKASMVTDEIDEFVENGIRLKSGNILEADVIVTATGLELSLLEGVEFYLDHQPLDFSKTITYKGMMFSGVPNMIQIFGYINASWTLRADMISNYFCRLMNQMKENKQKVFWPQLSLEEESMKTQPFILNFSSKYIQRSIHKLPRQGLHWPWRNLQNYWVERKLIQGPIDDGILKFEGAKKGRKTSPPPEISV